MHRNIDQSPQKSVGRLLPKGAGAGPCREHWAGPQHGGEQQEDGESCQELPRAGLGPWMMCGVEMNIKPRANNS